MGTLPSVTSKEVVRVLKKLGFFEDRQKGSHLILIHSESKTRVVVPVHQGKTIKKPLLSAIIKDSKVSISDFLDLL